MPRGTKLLYVPLWALRQNVPEMPLLLCLQSWVFHSWQQPCQLWVDGITETCFWGWNQIAQLPFLLLSCAWIPTSLLSTARSLDGLGLWHGFSSFVNIILVRQISPCRDFPLHWRMLFCVLTCCINITVHFTAGSFNMHFFNPANKLYHNITRNGWGAPFWRYIQNEWAFLNCM